MKAFVTLCSVSVLLLMMSAPCSAGIMAIDDPIEGGSWAQRFQENGVYGGNSGNYDLLAVKIVPVAAFETPSYSNFSDGSWILCYEDLPPTPAIASATGPSRSAAIQWDMKFAGEKSTPLSFDYVAYDGETLRGGGTCTWDGSVWTTVESSTPSWAPARSEVVPEPCTMAMLIAGGFAAVATVWIRRRYGMN